MSCHSQNSLRSLWCVMWTFTEAPDLYLQNCMPWADVPWLADWIMAWVSRCTDVPGKAVYIAAFQIITITTAHLHIQQTLNNIIMLSQFYIWVQLCLYQFLLYIWIMGEYTEAVLQLWVELLVNQWISNRCFDVFRWGSWRLRWSQSRRRAAKL